MMNKDNKKQDKEDIREHYVRQDLHSLQIRQDLYSLQIEYLKKDIQKLDTDLQGFKKWTLGLLIGSWVSVMLTIIGLYFK